MFLPIAMEDFSIFLQLPLELWTLFILPSCSLEMSLVSPAWRRLAFSLTFHDPRVAHLFDGSPIILNAPCARNHISVVRELLKLPSLTRFHHKPTYFLYACKYGHVELVRLLLQSPKVHSALSTPYALVSFKAWFAKIFAKWGQQKHIFTPSVTLLPNGGNRNTSLPHLSLSKS